MDNPVAFLSYSHDSDDHKDWVLNLGNRLVRSGVDIVLDQYDLKLGSNLPAYMEKGVSREHRLICICTERYVQKANAGVGGVGFEKLIMTGEMLNDLNAPWIIPIIRNNNQKTLPKFLSGKLFEDFDNPDEYELHFENLLRDLLNIPKHQKPAIGVSPFIQIKETGRIIFRRGPEAFHSASTSGEVMFSHSSNNGRYTIGDGEMLFELHCSRAGESSIHCYNYPDSIDVISVAYESNEISDIADANNYDYTSDHRELFVGEIALWQNNNGFFAATKLVSVEHRGKNSARDLIRFEYRILTHAGGDFSK